MTTSISPQPDEIMKFKEIANVMLTKHYGISLQDTDFEKDKIVEICIQQGVKPYQAVSEYAQEVDIGRVDLPAVWGEPSTAPLSEEDEEQAMATLNAASTPEPQPSIRPRF